MSDTIPSTTNETPLSLAPDVHGNAQLRAIHQRMKKKQDVLMGREDGSSRFKIESDNPVGAHVSWG